ncbi:hypothetical protein [Bacillus alveayuensis]|jgi:chromate transport protein ChrA|uniref:hypothetical protein n=1 Tax=Aeribacillus alveayuensis TaxID=279215 RepID=UPI0005D1018C|nr:hypothetical protein [Bacillus alveayuensis]
MSREKGEGGDWYELVHYFMTALKLSLTSFGGLVAHLGYFYEEYVFCVASFTLQNQVACYFN